jgi:hypothetical protein
VIFLLIGIKYCGGCNPKFDRAALVQKLKRELGKKYDFEYAKEGTLYDTILVVCGCTSKCAKHENLKSKREKLFIITDSDYNIVLEKIKHII